MIDVSKDVDSVAFLTVWVVREVDDLRRMRNELRVQSHVGRAELRRRWERLERTFATLESKAKRGLRVADEPLREIEQDLRQLAADLHEGYREIRDAI